MKILRAALVIVASAVAFAYLLSAYMQRSFEFDAEAFFVAFISMLALAVAMLVIALIRLLFKGSGRK